MSNENHSSADPAVTAASFYKEKMDSFLKERLNLPPTDYELKHRHENLQKEAFHKYRSFSVDSSVKQDESVQNSIIRAYNEVRRDHKEMRSRVLIDSAIGKNNYVASDN